jgi:DNA-binding PadR family transcriptional regulator
MNRLDKNIMIALLGSQQSMYGLEKSLEDTNYATVYRHIKRMQKNGLLSTTKVPRKNGKLDKRGTEKPELSTKGLATLIIDGNLEKEDLTKVMNKTLERDYSDLPAKFLARTNVDEIFPNTILKMRHKINLKFFDETYFNETFNISFAEALFDALKKHDFTKDTALRAKARKLRKKYVTSTEMENIRKLKQQFIREKNKFNHYAEILEEFLKVFDKWKV